MTRFARHFMWVSALVLGAALAPASPASAGDYSETCRYFAAQAFKDRRESVESTLAMNLAQDCVDALIYIRSDSEDVRLRAEGYLGQLQDFREVVVALLVARAREGSEPRTDLRRYVGPAVQPLSEAGAYLIARRMGLVDTHENWTAWRQSLAYADPRLRID